MAWTIVAQHPSVCSTPLTIATERHHYHARASTANMVRGNQSQTLNTKCGGVPQKLRPSIHRTLAARAGSMKRLLVHKGFDHRSSRQFSSQLNQQFVELIRKCLLVAIVERGGTAEVHAGTS